MDSKDQKIFIYDTTLRDGEQSPGASMNPGEKLLMARQLERLGVDVIEAGFPVSSEGDFAAVQRIARQVRGTEIAAIARANRGDIDRAWEALQEAAHPRLNIFISSSDIHLKHQLKKSRSEVLKEAAAAVAHARAYTDSVEFSAMDATRTERTYLRELFEAVIAAGAGVVNIPDTVGYAVPSELGALVDYLMAETAGIGGVILSVHGHDDLGLAAANTLAAVEHGARQVKCTINGIGERAGNAALEEVVMALATRRDFYGLKTGIKTEELCPTSRLLSRITGIPVQPNKAVVGANAFAHESGIHQDGLLRERSTYEIMTPRSVGASECGLVLGRHSGRHAVEAALRGMGHTLTEEAALRVSCLFKERAAARKDVCAADLEEIFYRDVLYREDVYTLVHLSVCTGEAILSRVVVRMTVRGEPREGSGCAGSPVEAVFAAIGKMVGTDGPLLGYESRAVMEGGSFRGEASVRLGCGGRTALGRGGHPDPVTAAAKAYIHALNIRAWIEEERLKKEERKAEESPCGLPKKRSMLQAS